MPGQSSGKLSDFRNAGDYSPDNVLENERLEKSGERWQFAFERGNALEAMCFDLTHDTRTFFDRFFISEQDNEPPDEIGRIIANRDVTEHEEKLKSLIVLNNPDKNGDQKRNATYKKRHAYIDECLAAPGKMPMSQTDYKILKELSEKMADLQLPDWYPFAEKVGYVWERCLWQEPIYWEREIRKRSELWRIKKKALCDNLLLASGCAILMDIKYSATHDNAMRMMRSKYWLQGAHYQEGVSGKYSFGQVDIWNGTNLGALPMLFVVGIGPEKGKPATATIKQVDDRDLEKCREEYQRVSMAYHEWEKSGRLPVGRLEPKQVRIWI